MAQLTNIPATKVAKYWQGDTVCNHCDNPCKGDIFDVRTYSGQGGTFCLPCAKRHCEMKMGLGSGQHYKETLDGKWLNVAG